MLERRVYVYAVEKETARVLRHQYLRDDDIGICNLINLASRLVYACKHANVEVYAIDMRPGLARDYQEAQKSTLFTDWVHFRDILQREGVQLA